VQSSRSFSFFNSLHSLHQFFDEKRSQISFLALFLYFKDHCFIFLCLFQLSALIDVVVRRNDNRRCVNFALSIRFRDRHVRCQNDDNLRRISFNIIQFVVYLFQRYRHLFLHRHVNNKTLTRWERNSDMNAFISSIDLSRRKLLIFLIMCSLRLFIESFFNVVRIFIKTSEHLINDDITSIHAKDLCVFYDK
jgi:hypothetical protein